VSVAIDNRDEWLQARRTGLGGSDAAAALGLSPYKTPFQLWQEKLGIAEDTVQSERAEWGIRIEPIVADWYEDYTGRKVQRVNRILRHPNYDFMLANIDRRVVGEKRGLEIKCVDKDAARSDEWGEEGTDEIPLSYLLQVHHYLAVTGWERFDLAALVGGNRPVIYTIERDDEMIDSLVQAEATFWTHVQMRTEPPCTSTEEAKLRWPQSVPVEIEATPDVAQACRKLRMLKADAKEIEERIDGLAAMIQGHMGESDTLVYCGEALATWKTCKPTTRFDAKRFAAEHPDISAQYQAEFTQRRFLLKGKGE